jgi:hypothetical protein
LSAISRSNRLFLPAVEATRIQNFHWHDLGHTFASRLVMAGLNPRTGSTERTDAISPEGPSLHQGLRHDGLINVG